MTDEAGANRKERHRLTHLKIRGRSDAVRVKLADRIANMEASMEQRSHLRGMYRQEHAAFRRIALVEPLADNLRLKKKYMQSAIGFYGQAAAYQVSDVTLQSTFSIANIYQDFSVALLDSERPGNLSADELEQYNMLLEDQAFPFEEKSHRVL